MEVPKDAKAVIYVGDTAAARVAGIDVQALGAVECRLKTAGGKAFIAARTGMGVNNGVQEFLERFADYWTVSLWGEDDPVVKNPNLFVPSHDFTLKPAIRCREVFSGVHARSEKDHAYRRIHRPISYQRRFDFERRQRTRPVFSEYDPEDRLSSQTVFCHSQFDYLPPEKYFKSHPEWYSMDEKGVRHGVRNEQSQLCYTNPGAFEKVAETMLAKIAADRQTHPSDYPSVYDFTQMDQCARLCLCPGCRAVIARHNRVSGGHAEGGDMGLQLDFVNRLARRVAERYPDVILRVFAYVSTEEVPVGIVPDDNVMVWLCDLYSWSDHERPLGTGPMNAKRAAIVDAWSKIAKRMEIWDYMLTGVPWGGAFPEVNATALQADSKFFCERGINRIFLQHEFHSEPFWDLNTFLAGHFYFDPDRDLGLLLDKYCRLYGNQAARVRRAIDYLMMRMATSAPPDESSWWPRTMAWRNGETFSRLKEMLEPAYAGVENPVTRSRLALVLAECCREILPCLQAEGRIAEYEKAKKDFLGYVRVFLPYSLMEAEERAEYMAAAEGMVGMLEADFSDMPEVFVGVTGRVAFDYRALGVRDQKRMMSADADSPVGFASSWQPDKPMPRIDCGLYDFTAKKSLETFSLELPTNSTRYAWHRLGVGRITVGSALWLTPRWSPVWRLGKLFRNCDGAADVNWFEFWVSARRTEDGVVRIDRLLMRRVPEPGEQQ